MRKINETISNLSRKTFHVKVTQVSEWGQESPTSVLWDMHVKTSILKSTSTFTTNPRPKTKDEAIQNGRQKTLPVRTVTFGQLHFRLLLHHRTVSPNSPVPPTRSSNQTLLSVKATTDPISHLFSAAMERATTRGRPGRSHLARRQWTSRVPTDRSSLSLSLCRSQNSLSLSALCAGKVKWRREGWI